MVIKYNLIKYISITSIVQEHESENLVSFNTKNNQGLTNWDGGMKILEQHQVVCIIKLWYQKYLWAILG